MLLKDFSRLLLLTVALLLTLNYVVLHVAYSRFDMVGAGVGFVVLLALNGAVLYGLKKVNVVDEDGKPQDFAQTLTSVLAVTLLIAVFSIASLVVAIIVEVKTLGKAGMVLPVLALAALYAPLAVVAKAIN